MMTHSPDYYEGVRAAIAALPSVDTVTCGIMGGAVDSGRARMLGEVRKRLEKLLPDLAETLVEDWLRHEKFNFSSPDIRNLVEDFARHLIRKDLICSDMDMIQHLGQQCDQGIIDPDKVK